MLFTPLGIDAAEWALSPMETAITGNWLKLRSRDWLKLAQLYADDGTWAGTRVVSDRWVAASTAPLARIEDGVEYGYLWWLARFGGSEHRSRGAFMSGHGGNRIGFFRELGLAFAVTSTRFDDKAMPERTHRVVDAIVDATRSSTGRKSPVGP